MRLHPDTTKLLAEIRAYCARTGLPDTRFGVEALNDGHLLRRLRAGRELRRDTIARIHKFMKNGKKHT
jgi:hypothetical protein